MNVIKEMPLFLTERAITVYLRRLKDYCELTKPRLSALVVFTGAMGYLMATQFPISVWDFVVTLIGIYLIVGGANGLNQVWERDRDRLMERTRHRPLPSGRIVPLEGTVVSLIMAILGWVLLVATSAYGLAGWVALAALLIYVLCYTPMKTRTWLCTFVGALAGASPPVIGWFAGGGGLTFVPLILFVLQYLWQLPHFWSIGHRYRDEYKKAGFRVMPEEGTAAISVATLSSSLFLILFATTLLKVQPSLLIFLVGLLLNGWLLFAATRFALKSSDATAKGLLMTVDCWLPAFLILLVIVGL
ncbi:MAG: heme o synthase [Armatimonadetes bacterium]|nr:heme o synthase [Armatimonadota bacterium]MDW8121817.1 heme o synthase [Armatimonadota bacterium]